MIIKEIPQSGDTRHFKFINTKTVKDVNGNEVEIEAGSRKVHLQELREKKRKALKAFQEAKAEYLALKEFADNNERLPMPEPVEEVKEVELVEEEVITKEDLEEKKINEEAEPIKVSEDQEEVAVENEEILTK